MSKTKAYYKVWGIYQCQYYKYGSSAFPNITQLRTGSTAAWLFENHVLLAETIPVKNIRFVEPQY